MQLLNDCQTLEPSRLVSFSKYIYKKTYNILNKMLYKTFEGKSIEILRNNFKDDKSYYTAIMKAKGFNQRENK